MVSTCKVAVTILSYICNSKEIMLNGACAAELRLPTIFSEAFSEKPVIGHDR